MSRNKKQDWHIHKRPGSSIWQVYIKNPRGGKPIRQSAGTAEETKAREFARKLAEEVWSVDILGEKPDRLWAEAAERWLAECADKKSLKADISRMRYLYPFFYGKRLSEITRGFMSDVINQLINERGISKTTANRYTALVAAILNKAFRDWEWLDSAPVFQKHRETGRRTRILTVEELQMLLADKLLPTHQRQALLFAVSTGLRQANVIHLKWSWVDISHSMLVIPEEEAKAGKAITVMLNDTALSVLNECAGIHSEYVFTYRGQPIQEINTKAWRKALKRNGIEGFTWHGLRHTFASWLAMNGATAREIQEACGWSSQQMAAHYTHYTNRHLLGVTTRLDTIFTQSLGKDACNDGQVVDSMVGCIGLEPMTNGLRVLPFKKAANDM